MASCAGAERRVCATLNSDTPVSWALEPSAAGACSAPVSSQCQTRVAGIPAVLLEVVDLADPIEVGNEVTYEIRVTNQGSKALTNVKLICTLPGELEFVSASGATPSQTQDRTITTDPLPVLGPKSETSWRVVARALSIADARFKVELTSEEFARPVEEYEATLLY